MKHLIVRQNTNSGTSRTWRLHETSGASTLGTSRLARLTSADPKSHGIEGAFESRGGNWYWLNLNPEDLHSPAEIQIQQGTEIKLANSVLACAFHEKDYALNEKLSKSTGTEAGSGSETYELELIQFGNQILSTKVLKTGAPESAVAKQMKKVAGDRITVLRRPVHLSSAKEITKSQGQTLDQESKRGAIIIAGASILFALGALFGPKTAVQPVAALPPIPQKVTVAMLPTQPKKGSVAEKKMQEVAKQAPAAPTEQASSGGASRPAGVLRAASSGRLSKLLGKVSAQAARSKEVIVSNGVKAGEGPSGQALAAMGKVDKAGGDWSSAASGTGVSVSTAGKGGGRSVAGMAGLQAGNTGSAGVGLIEDESEITGGLDRDVIASVIKGYLGQILYCYERQLSANPDLFGKVAVRFTIGPNGGVETQAIGDTTLKNATVEGCILNRVAGWKFPSPSGGTKVMVTYPFLFKSTN